MLEARYINSFTTRKAANECTQTHGVSTTARARGIRG